MEEIVPTPAQPGYNAAGLPLTPVAAFGAGDILISEANTEQVKIELSGSALEARCAAKNGDVFSPALHIGKVTERLYLQPLDSIVSDDANYLKAARMGGGIYMHLPYFVTAGPCKDIDFEVKARHILWDGKWYQDALKIPALSMRQKSVFFTNEAALKTNGPRYVDASIAPGTLAGLESSFSRINQFYEETLEARPLNGVGVVVALVHNKGNYSGFGGDSLNIIRMSYDNPSPKDLSTLEQVFPATFAHELAHKLQSARLFTNPLGRQIVEGSADFFKILVLRNSGLITESEAKQRVLKAAADCAALSDSRSLREKISARAVNYREPYDCGMVYYFVSYYSSGLSGRTYVETLRRAFSGETNYAGQTDTLCMLFEPSCTNERLNGVIGNKVQYSQQVDWLAGQLAAHPLPTLEPRK